MNEVPSRQQLTLYDAARHALAEARRVDEVKDIVDRAAALAEYARRAKDIQMLNDATDLRLDAERKGGEILAQMAEKGERDSGRGNRAELQAATPPIPTLADLGVTKTQSSRWQKLAALPPEKYEIRKKHAKARVAGMTTSAPSYTKAEYTGENEWFTPEPWIARARVALGEIDLDPASHVIAQQTVQAKRFFTIVDDGLTRPWFGRVWLNPPYNRALLAPFIDKLVTEYASGRVEQAILLTHNYTDTEWFHTAANAANVICFPSGRIRFLSPAGDECSPTQGQAFFYFGNGVRFDRVFADFGLMLRPA
jgi:hypothetical protein